MKNKLKGNRRGLALLAVLWTLTLLSVIAASFSMQTRSDIDRACNAVDNARAEAFADAGVYRAVHELLQPRTEDAWAADSTVHEFPFLDGAVRVSIIDEAAKVDLNSAPDELLRGLLLVEGVDLDDADALVDAIVDFRDPDDLRRLHGAEDADYLAAGMAHDAKDQPFEAVEELMQVIGMSAPLYERLAPHITVHSEAGTINPASARREVLLALPGVNEADIDAYLQSRAAEIPGNLTILTFPGAGAAELLARSNRASVVMIIAEGRPPDGGVFVRKAVVDLDTRDQPPFTIRTWQRGSAADLLPPVDDVAEG